MFYIWAILIFPYFTITVLLISISSFIHKKAGFASCIMFESFALSRDW